MHLCLTSNNLSYFLFSFLCFQKDIYFLYRERETGTSLALWVSNVSVKAFSWRFYLLCFIFDPANSAFSSTAWTRVILRADSSCPACIYSRQSEIWIQNIPHEFLLFLLCIHLKSMFYCNGSLDSFFFFFFIFCMIIPKKGIFYWHTSTSFVIDCANKHVHNLNRQCAHDAP